MKKRLIITAASLAALGATIAPTISSCSKKKDVSSPYFEITTEGEEVILTGFKNGLTQEQIAEIFKETLTIPASVTTIAKKAFYDSETKVTKIPSSIKNLKFQDGTKIKTICGDAFNCSPFENIELPPSLTKIEYSVFKDSLNIKEVNFQTPLDGDPIDIGSGAFTNCSSLEKVNLPKNTSYVGDDIFSHCHKIKTIDLSQLTEVKLGKTMFFDAATETGAEITIDCDVTAYEWEVELDSAGLVFSGDKPCKLVYKTQLFNIVKDDESEVVLKGWSDTCTEESIQKYLGDTLKIPNNIRKIADNAFYDATTNASKMPSFITKLGIDLENSKLYQIGANAFNSWKGLTDLTLDSKVSTIKDSAFAQCSNLNHLDLTGWRVDMPDASKWATNIFNDVASAGTINTFVETKAEEWKTFLGARGIDTNKWEQKITAKVFAFEDDNKTLKGFDSNLTDSDVSKIYTGKTSIAMPAGTEIIGDWAFYDVEREQPDTRLPDFITELDLTDTPNLTEIKANAFMSSHIETIKSLPATLKTLGSGCFERSKMKSFDFTNITTIGYSAFSQTKLSEVDLKTSNVTKIEESAFANVDTLTKFVFPSGLTDGNLGKYALAWCDFLKNVENWPTALTNTGTGTFYGCHYLPEATIQSIIDSPNINTIGVFSFRDCKQLKNVKIPAKITTLSEGAFEECNYLTKIDLSDISCEIPAGFSRVSVFKNIPSHGTIIVNTNCTDQQIETWTEYFKGFGLEFAADKWEIVKA